MEENNKMRGTVKWFDARRGYGFICDTDGVDCYVHYSDIEMDGFRKLKTGQDVIFLSREDETGRRVAREVIVA